MRLTLTIEGDAMTLARIARAIADATPRQGSLKQRIANVMHSLGGRALNWDEQPLPEEPKFEEETRQLDVVTA